MATYPSDHGWLKGQLILKGTSPTPAFSATSGVGAVLGSVFVANAGCHKIFVVRCATPKNRHLTSIWLHLSTSLTYTIANELWESKSAASLLRFNSSQKVNQPQSRNGSIAVASSSSPVLSTRRGGSVSHGRPDGYPVEASPVLSPALLNAQITPTDGQPIRPRTMAEIEAEMQAVAARQQHHSQDPSLDHTYQPPGLPSTRPVPREEHFQHQQQRSFPNGEALLEHMQQHMPLQAPMHNYQHQHQRHPHAHLPSQPQPAMELQALLDRNDRMRFPDPITMPQPQHQYMDQQARVSMIGQQLAASRQALHLQELMIQQHQQHQQILQQHTDIPPIFHLAPEEKEAVVANVHRRIQEAELLEAKRHRKAAKISEYVRLLYPISHLSDY